MKMRNKKTIKYILMSIVILAVIAISVFGIQALNNSKKAKADADSKGNKTVENDSVNKVYLTGGSDGSISLIENEFYRIYYIQCKNQVNTLKYEDTAGTLNLTLGKADVESVSFKTDSSALINKQVVKVDENNNIILKFNKLFPEGNKINLKLEDNKIIVVKIAKVKKDSKPILMLDAGHGGKDIGSSSGNLIEKNITLKIVKYMNDYIKTKNIDVILTRDSDVFHFVKDLEKTANESPADLYVSLHVNLFTGGAKYNGIQTDYDFLNQALGADSLKLAKSIQSEVIKNDGWNNRGVINNSIKADNERLYIRKIDMPSALVECGFLSNADDKTRLGNEDVLKNLAVNISNGIINYLKETGK